MSQALCQTTKSMKINDLIKKPRSEDRGTFAGRGNNCRAAPLGSLWPGRVKHQPKPVDAVAQAGGFRSVVEHVSHVSAAAAAVDFRARHPERRVLGFANGIVERFPEARPAGAALIFGFRG